MINLFLSLWLDNHLYYKGKWEQPIKIVYKEVDLRLKNDAKK